MKMTMNRTTGFTLVEIMIVVAVIGVLAAVALPSFVRYRISSRKNTCIANLRQIENAKQVWANEGNKSGGSQAAPGDLFGPDKYLRAKPLCPSGGLYSIEIVDEKPKCSFGTIEDHTL